MYSILKAFKASSFELIGNRYFCIYQINDKNFYATPKALYLKTLLMPLGIKFSKTKESKNLLHLSMSF
jgi:hypothetical protein